MAAHNRGIEHVNWNGQVLCGNRRAHMYTSIEKFKQDPDSQCKRCATKLAKIEALDKRRQPSPNQ